MQQQSTCDNWGCPCLDIQGPFLRVLNEKSKWMKKELVRKTNERIRRTRVSIVEVKESESLVDFLAIRTLMAETRDKRTDRLQLCGSLDGKQCLDQYCWTRSWDCGAPVHYCLLFWHIQLCPSWGQTLVFTELLSQHRESCCSSVDEGLKRFSWFFEDTTNESERPKTLISG